MDHENEENRLAKVLKCTNCGDDLERCDICEEPFNQIDKDLLCFCNDFMTIHFCGVDCFKNWIEEYIKSNLCEATAIVGENDERG